MSSAPSQQQPEDRRPPQWTPATVRERQLKNLEAMQKDFPDHPVTNVAELNKTLLLARKHGHLISPVDAVDYIMQMHAVSFRFVFLDPFGRDCYRSKLFCSEDERALASLGIGKLWKQASGSVTMSRSVGDVSDQRRRTYRVAVNLRGIDGRDNYSEATREVDLRPGSPQLHGMDKRQIDQASQNVGTLAETKGRLRAIRAAMALAQKYTIEEYTKPFIIPVLVPLLDTEDPVIRRLVAANALGIVHQIYGQQPRQLAGATPGSGTMQVDAATGEVIDADVVGDPVEDDDEDFPAPTVPPPVATAAHCTDCPCGCTAEVKPQGAAISKDQIGVVRCKACYPWRQTFERARHEGFQDLKIPKFPGKDVAALIGAAK